MTAPASGRPDGRHATELRPVEIVAPASIHAEGSVLILQGNTRVLCTASVDERAPRWLQGKGRGWVTAEYSMLPRATTERTNREAATGKQGGRTMEIQRLIGRSLRAAVDLTALGERQIILDCDVLQADAGTRCASITGAFVALSMACDWMLAKRMIRKQPIVRQVAAISVGLASGVPVLDLNYLEDSKADVDANIVMTSDGGLVEVQMTAEGAPFRREQLDELVSLAAGGIEQLFEVQRRALAKPR